MMRRVEQTDCLFLPGDSALDICLFHHCFRQLLRIASRGALNIKPVLMAKQSAAPPSASVRRHSTPRAGLARSLRSQLREISRA